MRTECFILLDKTIVLWYCGAIKSEKHEGIFMTKNTKILSIVSIALGVCSIALGLLEFIVLGMVLGVAGGILSIVAKKKAKAEDASALLANIGLAASIVGVITCIVMLILYFIHESEKDAMFKGAIDAIYYGDK